MFGRGLIVKAASVAAMAACVFVAIVALGLAVYYTLSIVLIPAGAAAVTALIFAIGAFVAAMLLGYKPEFDEEAEPEGLTDRAVQLFRTRPILGTVAGLAAGWIFLRNPALATMVAAAFTEKAHTAGRRRR